MLRMLKLCFSAMVMLLCLINISAIDIVAKPINKTSVTFNANSFEDNGKETKEILSQVADDYLLFAKELKEAYSGKDTADVLDKHRVTIKEFAEKLDKIDPDNKYKNFADKELLGEELSEKLLKSSKALIDQILETQEKYKDDPDVQAAIQRYAKLK